MVGIPSVGKMSRGIWRTASTAPRTTAMTATSKVSGRRIEKSTRLTRRQSSRPERRFKRTTEAAHSGYSTSGFSFGNLEDMSKTLTVEYPETLPDSLHMSQGEFEREARLAMAVKLFELGRVSSGQAAQLAGIPRVHFLYELGRFKVSPFQYEE